MRYDHYTYVESVFPSKENWDAHIEARVKAFRKLRKEGWEPTGDGILEDDGTMYWPFRRPIPGTKLVSEMTEAELRQIIREELDRS